MGKTVIIDCLFLSRKNHGGTAPLAPLALTPLIIVRFSALAIPAESAIADKKKKKENSFLYYWNNSQRLWISLFSKIELKMKKKSWKQSVNLLVYCSVAKQNKKNIPTCKSQWKMDLVINYSSDIIIDNFSYVYETKYTSSNCTMRWNIFWRSICGLVQLNKYKKAPCFFPKIQTFWETHNIWKNLPHGFDKSADLLSKRQNHVEDFFKFCVLLRKSEFYKRILTKCGPPVIYELYFRS